MDCLNPTHIHFVQYCVRLPFHTAFFQYHQHLTFKQLKPISEIEAVIPKQVWLVVSVVLDAL